MDRYVMRNPEIPGVALIPESSMRRHKANGWVRVSNAIAEDSTDQVDLEEYASAEDLDEVKPAQPEPAPKPAKQTQEK